MALSDLSIGNMILVLKVMLHQEKPRAVLDSHPLLRGFVPFFEDTLQALESTRITAKQQPSTNQALSPLRGKMRGFDRTHDRANRINYALLTLAAEICEDETSQEKFIELRDELYPQQLKVNQMTHADEAGEAIRMEKQIAASEALRTALGAITIHNGVISLDALTLCQRVIQTGHQMQQTLSQMSVIEAGGASAETQARRLFIGWVSRAVDLAGLLLKEDPQALETLFKELDTRLADAEKKDKEPDSTEDKQPDEEIHTAQPVTSPHETPTPFSSPR